MARGRGDVRIIGGRWRNTRIAVAEREGLRPTPDRVRETLFNWLAPRLTGARCLDLFAGSGVLGFEALSRGAAAVTLVEQDRVAADALHALRQRLDAAAACIVRQEALAWLAACEEPFDIVFVDPPFGGSLARRALAQLVTRGLAPEGCVYIETAVDAPPPDAAWQVLKSGQTRETRYQLLETSALPPA